MKDEYEYQQETSFKIRPIVCDEPDFIMLTLNNGIIQPNQIYVANISASNSTGSSNIVQNLIISKCQNFVMQIL